jgi:outer membrane immunogenic protein
MQLTLRNTVLVILAAAALALAWFYLSAARAEAGSFTGCYGGGAAGYTHALGKLTEGYASEEYSDAHVIDSLGAGGETFAVLAGCDMQVQKFVFGVWGDFSWHNADFSEGWAGEPADLATGLDTSWAVGGRAGYVFVPGAMVYVLAGYTQAELNDVTSPADGPEARIAVPSLEGYVLGAGSEVGLGGGLYLDVRGTYANYDKVSITGPDFDEGEFADLDVDVLTARVGLIYRLWGDEASAVAKEIEALAPAQKPLK